MKIAIFHHNDNDGYFSAAVVGEYHRIDHVDYFEWWYGKSLPFQLIFDESNSLYDRVYLVDLSFPDFFMNNLVEQYGDNFVWIDHHKTALEECAGINAAGLRRIGTAACELCWEYFYPDTVPPLIIQYISAFDVWDKSRFDWDKVVAIKYWAESFHRNDPRNILGFACWNNDDLDQWATIGTSIKDYVDLQNKRVADSGKFQGMIYKYVENKVTKKESFGVYKAIFINTTARSSEAFKSIENLSEYDVMIPFTFNGEAGKFSIYSTKEHIDCGELAKSKEGGGHKGAAGFQLNRHKFINFLSTKSLVFISHE